MSTVSTFIQQILNVLATTIREEKEIKGIQVGKEVKLSLFTDDMILYIEDSKDTTRKLLELINEFGQIAGQKINIEKAVVFLYMNNELSKREIKEMVSFTITEKNKKPGNKLTQ